MALLVFGSLFAVLLVLSYRRRRRLQIREQQQQQRFQYFRTLPNGQVVALPSPRFVPPVHRPQQQPQLEPPPSSQPPRSTSSDDNSDNGDEDDDDEDDEDNELQISNPAYNETRIPTRPII
jgi:hypothetical protein